MLLREITTYLEDIAPPVYQETYDNAGLITGHQDMQITGVLVCLDSTEEVLEEALLKNCNLIIAHHPIIFKGLKRLTGKNYVERTIIKAIKNNLAIYAMHTNLDNVREGVNAKIAEKLGLQHTEILVEKTGLLNKLVTFVPLEQAENLRQALFMAGAGKLNKYDSCSFSLAGTGSFKGNDQSEPFVGEKGKLHFENEIRIEVVYEKYLENALLKALRSNHPYEEPAFDCYPLLNNHPGAGSGMIGSLPQPMKEEAFLAHLKKHMQADCIRHTRLPGRMISRVAVAGGSGSFLLADAIKKQADIFVTADFKYHEFFDAENKLIIADIGHYESEQFTKELIYGFLFKKFPTFAFHLSEINTNPLKYF